MSIRLDGKDIIDSYETWAVLRDGHLVEFDDKGEVLGSAVTAEESARHYAQVYGGEVKRATCFYTDWENA